MTLLVVFLLAGLIVGYQQWLPDRWAKLPGMITTGGLFALLFLMGMQIGSSSVVIQEIFVYGGQAFVLAAGAVVGSTAAVWAAVRLAGLGGSGDDDV